MHSSLQKLKLNLLREHCFNVKNVRPIINCIRKKMTSMSSIKPEGDLSSVFATLSNDDMTRPLESRFIQLKQEIIGNHEQQIKDSWYRLLDALKYEISLIDNLGSNVIPQIDVYEMKNLSIKKQNDIRSRGVMIIRNVLSEANALKLKQDTINYIKKNPNTKGFPQDKPVVYELYWSPSQISARADKRVVETLKFANSFWHSSSTSDIVFKENLVYADRLRIRQPGDTQFGLSPHVDGGSIERWEDPQYRLCYKSIFQGHWEDNDFFDGTHRAHANMSLYNAIGGCSVFRSWQGWLSLSTVKPGEGGLLVNPMLKCATSYWLLRPFFTRTNKDEQWKIDKTSVWPGAIPGRVQEINDIFHPDLELSKSMVSIPQVNPGDMVFWHCDTIHAVDSIHRGKSDSSVFYIPAFPLCQVNVEYLKKQRHAFENGLPPPDFPGGQGESRHIGRATPDDVKNVGGERAMGFQSFSIQSNMADGEKQMVTKANAILDL